MQTIENKVAKSGLITLDLVDFLRDEKFEVIDIEKQLWQGLALKEKDFRDFVSGHNWQNYSNFCVGIHCSADAIIPHWAYMLIASALAPFAKHVFYGNLTQLKEQLILHKINQLANDEFTDQRIVVKGCGEIDFTPQVYVALSQKLTPIAKSIMYGEPCSTVPIFKSKK